MSSPDNLKNLAEQTFRPTVEDCATAVLTIRTAVGKDERYKSAIHKAREFSMRPLKQGRFSPCTIATFKTVLNTALGAETGFCELSVEELSEKIGSSSSSVTRSLKQLTDKELIVRDTGGGRHRKTRIGVPALINFAQQPIFDSFRRSTDDLFGVFNVAEVTQITVATGAKPLHPADGNPRQIDVSVGALEAEIEREAEIEGETEIEAYDSSESELSEESNTYDAMDYSTRLRPKDFQRAEEDTRLIGWYETCEVDPGRPDYSERIECLLDYNDHDLQSVWEIMNISLHLRLMDVAVGPRCHNPLIRSRYGAAAVCMMAASVLAHGSDPPNEETASWWALIRVYEAIAEKFGNRFGKVCNSFQSVGFRLGDTLVGQRPWSPEVKAIRSALYEILKARRAAG